MPASAGRQRRLVAVSLKAYFSVERTEAYLDAARPLGSLAADHDVDLAVIPDFLNLRAAQRILASHGVLYGAQDTFWEDSGPYTGEITPDNLAELGCTFVELGHAERRRLLGETDAIVARKAIAACRHGLVPLVCIGEVDGEGGSAAAVEACAVQVNTLIEAIPSDADVVFAYEPVWAIGQAQPAPASHIMAVCQALRRLPSLTDRSGRTRFLYGGSAGPGVFAALVEAVDGLFLGRFAHDIAALSRTVEEVGSCQG